MLAPFLSLVLLAPAPVRHFAVAQRYDVRALPAGTPQGKLFVPLPQDDPWQQVTALSIEGAPFEIVHDTAHGNEAALVNVLPGGANLIVSYEIRRRERAADVSLADGDKVPDGYADALQSDRRVPIDDRLRALAHELTAGAATPLARARAIYDYVLAHMRYDKSGKGWGEGDVRWACDEHRGNCTDFHSLLIGLLRASGIPARFQIGYAVPETAGGDLPGYHCWADFYLSGAGWVPVDASEAWKHPERRAYFFGHHDADRFALSMGRDLVFPGMAGGPLNFFVYPYLEIDGKAAPELLSRKTTFRELDLHASAAPAAGPRGG
jgi:transglutaminase-like putative cysteine protease